ncbi:MAG: alpha amylase C-terminal domain-containing protein, partial [Planctomycetales bacterium]|nr:alpha amylase C-terminal domain-containing protein [Planctomycetales bacterium]
VREGYLLGAPQAGFYREIFNSDSSYYAGSNVGNFPGIEAHAKPHQGRPASMRINLPPLATVVFKPQ